MDKFKLAERYLPIQNMRNICFVAPTGTGKTTLLNNLLGLNPSSTPLISACGTTTIATQQVILSNKTNVAELFVKIRSKKLIKHLIEENLIEAVKTALKKPDEQSVYLAFGKDCATEFPLMYSLKRKSDQFRDVYQSIMKLKELFHNAEDVDNNIRNEELFHQIVKDVCQYLFNMLERNLWVAKQRDEVFEVIDSNNDIEDIFFLIKSKDELALFEFAKLFTGVDGHFHGELLTPMVDLVRLKVSSEGKFSEGFFNAPTEICFTDTVGVGQSGGISTELLEFIDTADYLFILQNAQHGFDSSLLSYVSTIANSGNTSKLRVIFTHADTKVKDDRKNQFSGDDFLDIWDMTLKFVKDPLLSGIKKSNISASAMEELTDWLDSNTFFFGKFDSGTFYSEKVTASLSSLMKTFSYYPVPKSREGIHNSPLTSSQTMPLDKDPSRFDCFSDEKMNFPDIIKQFIDLEIQKYKDTHWTRVKALSRRYAEKSSTYYQELDPVSSFSQIAMLSVRNHLEGNYNLRGEKLNNLCSVFFVRIIDYAKAQLFEKANPDWISSYNLSGTGSTFVRMDKIQNLFPAYLVNGSKKSIDYKDGIKGRIASSDSEKILSYQTSSKFILESGVSDAGVKVLISKSTSKLLCELEELDELDLMEIIYNGLEADGRYKFSSFLYQSLGSEAEDLSNVISSDVDEYVDSWIRGLRMNFPNSDFSKDSSLNLLKRVFSELKDDRLFLKRVREFVQIFQSEAA